MYENLENLLNSILSQKPAYREVFAKYYNLLSSENKEALNAHLGTLDLREVENDFLVILNSHTLEIFAQNLNSFLAKYSYLKGWLETNTQFLNSLNEVKDKVLSENNQHTDDPLYLLFLQTYQEFKGVDYEIIKDMFSKISCIYPKYKGLLTSEDLCGCDTYPFFMLVAHYLCIEGKAEKAGFNRSSGVVSSSSIDGVSVSYLAPQYKDNFQYFFTQTPYGQEYLAYINTNNVMLYVNNAKTRH